MEFLRSGFYRRILHTALGASFVWGMLLVTSIQAGQREVLDEPQILAQMIMNFPLVTTWPDAVRAEDGRINICALHESPVSRDVAAMINASRAAAQYRFMANVSDEQALNCHVLMIGQEDMDRMGGLWSRIQTRPVLTVGMAKHFLKKGGIIGFVHTEKTLGVFSEKTIRFEVNLAHAHAAGLNLDPMLLELAERIVTE